ncbi:MAG: hypothetical protein US86_C0001G0016 [Candidatus Daviesbacteria bacterium GW2011_GWA2_38_24]|uniref:Cof-like protein hydrolase n=1 Tax=Candidatus Daviesbacteria bacterium GW2011_GWA2_38_24 TaxID=1618422 RepID=A0A0G0M0C8_9BACT|nr:MAG: hypothetical protein US86_C0001G0016 [Candidatus Daviesbacteria bacterium GW2011_GWA2_38_24]KKQ80946.1 MAG: hypothetical protein UT01_C0003G0013 [Candidatus Daviesbacteria bacterium GW2011_GWA1_38_7]OGE22866.1 MAG: hypothetical protein A2688_04510 [Candidatus Daviesbacteria bacterium RIFCSPHIGHO2_01_FULL_38_8]
MTRQVKAVISDIDGTLVEGSEVLPSDRVRDAILEAKKKIHFGLATARQYQKTKHLFEYLNLSGPSILSNGAQVVEARTGKMIVEHPIDKNALFEVCRRLKNLNISWWIQDNGVDFFYRNYTPDKPFVVVANKVTQEQAERITQKLSDIEDVIVNKASVYADRVDVLITNPKATKQYAVFEIAKILDIKPKEMIGIGDGYNDLPLLMACGLKIAMGNAVPDLKVVADYIAPTVEKDGLADTLERFVIPYQPAG